MSEEKPEKRGFGIFDRRHSANTFGVRRSVSNVGFFSSRRNSTPTTQLTATSANGASTATATAAPTTPTSTTSSPMHNGGASNVERKNSGSGVPPGKRHLRAEKWQLLARKVLGNLDEEDGEAASAGGNELCNLISSDRTQLTEDSFA